MTDIITRPAFSSVEEAWQWVDEQDLEYADNHRFAYTDDDIAMEQYEQQQFHGCCGSFDSIIEVDGRRAYIGCNYGH